MTNEDSRTQPLAGLVVVELGQSVSAPFSGQILSELGAEVIKIERPDGDEARKWGPPFWEGSSAYFQALNRNKKSVVCDLRLASNIEALIALINHRADIVLQNGRPGKMAELGLDGASLLQNKPSLIYCNLGAFGSRGPLKDKPGYDPLMQAFGGIMSTTGEPGRPAVRVGASIVDMGTGMWAIIGIMAALRERDATGKGCIVDVSLYETATCWVSLLASQYLASGTLAEKQGSGASSIVPYKAYVTSDGEIVVAAGSDGLFRTLAITINRPEWLDDARFKDNPSRVDHQRELYALLDDIMLHRSTAEWIGLFDAAGIPCAPVQNLAQMLNHPQTAALDLVQSVPESEMKFLGLPLSLNGRRPEPRARPPKLGEHTDEILFSGAR